MPNHYPDYNIKSDYGIIHVYALTMTLGIIVSVFACYIKVKKKQLPGNVLLLSVVFIVPASLLSASFFGKVDFSDFQWSNFFSNFEFWNKSGGMSIHGGVLGGVIVSCIYFIYPCKKYKISMWVWLDSIVPNILLGQAIGRWGNFFNHELLGTQTTLYHLRWLPDWISHNCWKWDGGTPEGYPGHWVYREPIFLYESLADLSAWIFITFVIPNLGKWFGPKPWKKHSDKYNTSFKYSFKKKIFKNYTQEGYLTYNQIWDDVYYENTLDKEVISRIPNDSKYSRNLQSAHNPDRYWIVKAGAQGGAYFFLWNFIRLILETQRESDQLFLHNLRTIDYTVIGIISLIGLFLVFLSQLWCPYYFRKPGWVYEKDF